jgi:hypothetical protein
MMTRFRRVAQTLLIVGLGVTSSTVASVASAQSDSALAEGLFQEGRLLMKRGKAEEACPKFAESQRLDPSVGALLNLAMCHDRVGKTASAWASFKEVALMAKREKQQSRAYYAKRRAQELEGKLSRVLIEFAAPPKGVEVAIDDNELSVAALATPLPLDPGPHTIVVSAPGHEPHEQSLDVPEKPGEIVVRIPALAPIPSPPEPAPPPPPPEPVISPLLWVGGGVAAAGLLVGTVTGAVSLSKAGDFRDACPNDPCDPSLAGLRDEALVLANVSNVSFAFAGVGAALGVVGYFLSDFDGGKDDARHPAVPQVAANGLVWALP